MESLKHHLQLLLPPLLLLLLKLPLDASPLLRQPFLLLLLLQSGPLSLFCFFEQLLLNLMTEQMRGTQHQSKEQCDHSASRGARGPVTQYLLFEVGLVLVLLLQLLLAGLVSKHVPSGKL